MSSKFGLFRFLSVINLLIAGFLVLMLVLGLLFARVMSPMLIFMLLTGATVIHSLLSIGLQQSLKDPSRKLKASTPGGLRIMGFMAIFYAVLVITYGTVFLRHMDEILPQMMQEVPKMVQQMSKGQPAPSIEYMRAMMTGLSIVMILHAAAVLVNCALSFSYLRHWQETHPEQ